MQIVGRRIHQAPMPDLTGIQKNLIQISGTASCRLHLIRDYLLPPQKEVMVRKSCSVCGEGGLWG
jgi:hypothetical protein